jgi:hypothetical protein
MAEERAAISDYESTNGARPDSGTIDKPEGREPEHARTPPLIQGFEVYTPDIIDAGTERDYQPKRRGRKPGSKNRPRAESETQAPSNLAANLEHILLSIHTMGAAFLSCPELELDSQEAEKLARSIRELSKYYPISLDVKRMAQIDLAMMAAMIYGTRGVAIYRRLSREQKAKPITVMPNPKPAPKPETAAQPSTPAQPSQSTTSSQSRGPDLPVPHQWFGVDNQEGESQL